VIEQMTLVTGNAGKAAEYAQMLGIEVTPLKARLTEIQALDVADVVRRKAEEAYALLRTPVLVDDTGLSVKAWNGLPGALIAWFLDSVGPDGILSMAAGLSSRQATATTSIGYADAIFIPDCSQLTFAEMSATEKNRVSHRRVAVDEMLRRFRNGESR
jgi:non-canonical purine NTP pyrophosphatase (RdgB/HAM1 family)